MEPSRIPPVLGELPMSYPVQNPASTRGRGIPLSELLNPAGVSSPPATAHVNPNYHDPQQQDRPDTQSQPTPALAAYAQGVSSPWSFGTTTMNGHQPQFRYHLPEPSTLGGTLREGFRQHLSNLERVYGSEAPLAPDSRAGSLTPYAEPGFNTPNQHSFQPGNSSSDSNYSLPHLVDAMGLPALKRTKHCLLCLEDFSIESDNFPHECAKCSLANICATCLKDWFVDACRNEAKMPPKCCRIIPLSSVSKLLHPTEIELYKSKYEEWNTSDRLYCPVLTCSAFIPPRMLTEGGSVERPTLMQTEKSASKPIKLNVACPTCQASICTGCRSFSHTGACPTSDIDPELEGLLTKWKIKRCPKCRAGVRKVFGCAHVECRCGAHFCWECLQPMNICDGCDEEDEDDDRDYEYDDDDLDGNAGFYEGDGHEFGPEPYGTHLDSWACRNHVFIMGMKQPFQKTPNTIAECQKCFRSLKFDDSAMLPRNNKDLGMNGYTTEPGWPSNIFGEPAWQCMSGHIRCELCPKFPPYHRKGDDAWDVKCDCGRICSECTTAILEKEKGLPWECHCGLLVCAECKDSLISTEEELPTTLTSADVHGVNREGV